MQFELVLMFLFVISIVLMLRLNQKLGIFAEKITKIEIDLQNGQIENRITLSRILGVVTMISRSLDADRDAQKQVEKILEEPKETQ